MAQDNAERSPFGRSALGGAAGGFTYDGVMQDAVAREDRLRRTLRLKRWQDAQRSRQVIDARREQLEPERAGPSH
jgi:hypothetical protein